MDNTCRLFLKATRATADAKTRKAMMGAAVLGDARTGFTVELRDASQIYVAREHCRYCARVQAYQTVRRRIEAGAPLCDYAKA